jgi:hypothetical protein
LRTTYPVHLILLDLMTNNSRNLFALCVKFIRWTHVSEVMSICQSVRPFISMKFFGIGCLYWKLLRKFNFGSCLPTVTLTLHDTQIELWYQWSEKHLVVQKKKSNM